MSKKNELPPPDTSHTTMQRRLSVGSNPLSNTETQAAHTPPTGQVYPAHTRPMGRRGTRPDAEGMTRQSYYISREAADALDAAVDTVRTALGPEVPRHVALSAIIAAGAADADRIAAELAQARAAALAEQAAKLNPDT